MKPIGNVYFFTKNYFYTNKVDAFVIYVFFFFLSNLISFGTKTLNMCTSKKYTLLIDFIILANTWFVLTSENCICHHILMREFRKRSNVIYRHNNPEPTAEISDETSCAVSRQFYFCFRYKYRHRSFSTAYVYTQVCNIYFD